MRSPRAAYCDALVVKWVEWHASCDALDQGDANDDSRYKAISLRKNRLDLDAIGSFFQLRPAFAVGDDKISGVLRLVKR